jgi:hypothetical protein
MDADRVFEDQQDFSQKALDIFRWQATENLVYKRYLSAINCDPQKVSALHQVPFLPIGMFKQAHVVCGNFEAAAVFESSGTTGTTTSRHYVKDLQLYEKSFCAAFEANYGDVREYCILGLLPSYQERGASSLVYMVQHLIEKSGHPASGFYLYNFEALAATIQRQENAGQKTLLIGVTYALLDFAAAYPMALQHTIVMETGGMKGRKKELLRQEVHAILGRAFDLTHIHSEYGMTELLSQAYAKVSGFFSTPHWMQALLREEDDPFALHLEVDKPRTGALNIIDLANIHACSFIATEDVARLHPGGAFEVLGRMDHTDIRGCSLMAL